jgi:Protein of unknown function (DUF2752)
MKLADRAMAQVESLWNQAVQPRIDAIPRPTQDRIVGAVLFFPTAVVLFIATQLTASPDGYGTHRELGLGPCSFLTLFGIPCPMCGMTTAFTHFAHLHPLAGTLTQPFGLVLFLLTLGGFVVGGLELVRPMGRWRGIFHLIERHETAVAAFLLIGMIAGWTYKIASMQGIVHLAA